MSEHTPGGIAGEIARVSAWLLCTDTEPQDRTKNTRAAALHSIVADIDVGLEEEGYTRDALSSAAKRAVASDALTAGGWS